MIRPFRLRDSWLLRRLGRNRIALNAQFALTRREEGLRGALRQHFFGGDRLTYVWRANGAAGYAHLYHEPGTNVAQILTLASSASSEYGNNPIDEDVWLTLLDALMVEAGRRGIHSVVAEVREDGPELPILRQAGFAVYTRQDVWTLRSLPHVWLSAEEDIDLRRPTGEDAWDIELLYSHIVPNMIQLVEPHPPTGDHAWVVRERAHEIAAYVAVSSTAQANWMQFWVHPNASVDPSRIIAATIRQRLPRRKKPLYCCVRRYQAWLTSALRQNGFMQWGAQAVMVKHTVQYVKKPIRAREILGEVEAAPSTATTPPIMRRSDNKEHRG